MNEQQRYADWAAVHRPETTTEELARIVRDHPEFAPAVMAHEHAPGSTPYGAYTEAPATRQGHLTDVRAQQGFQPAARVHTHPNAQAQVYPHHAASAPSGFSAEPVNRLAYAALIVAAASSIASFSFPFIIRGLIMTDATAAIGFVNGAITWVFIIVTAILALLALKKPGQPRRGRWAAYAALGAAGTAVLGFLASAIGNFFVNFLPYY